MSHKVRNILLGVIVLVIIIIVALPFLLSANTFRPTVEEKLSAALGRKVTVGDLNLSLLSSSLVAKDLTIADDARFSNAPFLQAKSVKIGVEIAPLIQYKLLNITGLTITNPEVNLIHNASGNWNISTLGATGNGPQAAPAAPKGPGSTPDVRVAKLKLEDGRVTIASTATQKKSVYDNLDVEASHISLITPFPVTVTAKLPGGGTFKLAGQFGPFNQADATLTPLDAKLNVSNLDLSKAGFSDPAAGISGIVTLDDSITSQNGHAHAKGTITATKLQVVKNGAPAGVPVNVDYDVDYNLASNAGLINKGVVKIGSAVANLVGQFRTAGTTPSLAVRITGENLPVRDLEAALPAFGVILPRGSSLQSGTMNANLNVTGPTDKLVTTGTVGLFNANLSGFDMGSKLAAISALSGVQTGQNTSIEKLTTNVRVAPEMTQLSNVDLVVPSIGQMTGAGTVSPNNALNFKMIATVSGQSGVVSTLGALTGRRVSNTRVPFSIQGTTSDPKFVPDVGGMVGSQLGGMLSGGQTQQNQDKGGIGGALQGLFGKKKPK